MIKYCSGDTSPDREALTIAKILYLRRPDILSDRIELIHPMIHGGITYIYDRMRYELTGEVHRE